jgi:hypothetical protein
MEQCPVCQKIFSATRYLISHLQLSECRTVLTNIGTVSSSNTHSTSVGTTSFVHPSSEDRNSSSTSQPMDDLAQHVDVIHCSQALNAFGDMIVAADDNSSSSTTSFPMLDMDESPIMVEPAAISDMSRSPPAPIIAPKPFSILPNESFNVPISFNEKLTFMLKLVTAVRTAGAPLSLVDVIVKIIIDEWQVGRLDITNLCTHQTAMRRISQMFPSLPTPISVTMTHERTIDELNSGSKRPSLTFPKFSFLGQMQDLLDDHIFSDLQNLVVDPSNRWDYYKRNSCLHSPDEIQDGDWFQGIVQAVHANPPPPGVKDFVFGIQGYVDKTGTDAYQRTAVEPLVFTLTLLTNHVRNTAKYWRVLALLPASLCQKQKKKHSFGASVRNYHIALRHAFAEFVELQKNPPILRMRLGDQCQYVRARLYWVNTIADGLANEQLTGRIQNRTSSPRISRGCHCPQHLADDSHLSCRFLTQAALEHLTVAALGPAPDDDQQWQDYLESLGSNKEKRAAEFALKTRKKIAQAILKNVFGQHVVDLVWFHVDQGPNPRGCFGSTPVDPMHAFEEGIVPNIMSVIIDPLPESAKSSLDALALDIISCNRWDSDYPRMNFSGGFSSLTQLTADEKVGKMMLLWIIMQTPLGLSIMEKRCNPSFDAQRAANAAKFTSRSLDDDNDGINDDESEPDDELADTSIRVYSGTSAQHTIVRSCLEEHALSFVTDWLEQMQPYHQDLLMRTVFQIEMSKGKGQKHILPHATFLDRHCVTTNPTELYCNDDVQVNRTSRQELNKVDAEYSLDCTPVELQSLLEMLLSFHAAYKYGQQNQRTYFDKNVRLMLAFIKRSVKRGKGTKNWLISKFHELLHISTDIKNFGSSANIDASKGEHGLKNWAKLPSKTVRTRDANLYYHDMATRIYENRLLELANATLVPGKVIASNAPPQQERQCDVDNNEQLPNATITIDLGGAKTKLDMNGHSSLPPELTNFLRNKTDLRLPIELYQEARYSQDPKSQITIRGTHNYRNSGPWHDCVYVAYEDNHGHKKEYPYQVYGFFEDTTSGRKSAVGIMGQHKRSHSQLMDEWTYEKQYRIIDLETMSQVAFTLTVPASCYKPDYDKVPHRMFVIKDRINEWPEIFNNCDWSERMGKSQKKRKRKTRK